MKRTHAQTVSYPLKDLYKLWVWNNLDDNYEEKIGENVFEKQRFYLMTMDLELTNNTYSQRSAKYIH